MTSWVPEDNMADYAWYLRAQIEVAVALHLLKFGTPLQYHVNERLLSEVEHCERTLKEGGLI